MDACLGGNQLLHPARGNPDVVIREIEVRVKREVGFAYGAKRRPSDALQGFIAKIGKRRPGHKRAR